MSQPEKNAALLNDLLAIQHERIATYQTFMKYPLTDDSVYSLFRCMADRSRNLLFELRSNISSDCIDPADRVEKKGEIGKTWPGMKYFTPDSSVADIFSCCEYNEWITMMTYRHALEVNEDDCPELRSLIVNQFDRMKESYEIVHAQKEKPVKPAIRSEERVPFLFTRGEVFETA